MMAGHSMWQGLRFVGVMETWSWPCGHARLREREPVGELRLAAAAASMSAWAALGRRSRMPPLRQRPWKRLEKASDATLSVARSGASVLEAHTRSKLRRVLGLSTGMTSASRYKTRLFGNRKSGSLRVYWLMAATRLCQRPSLVSSCSASCAMSGATTTVRRRFGSMSCSARPSTIAPHAAERQSGPWMSVA